MLHQVAQDLVLLSCENLHRWRCQSLSGPLFQCSVFNSIPSCLSSSYPFPSSQPSFFGVWVQRSTAGSTKLLFLCLLEFQLTRWDSFCPVSKIFEFQCTLLVSIALMACSWEVLTNQFLNKTNSVLLKPRIFIPLFVFLASLGVWIPRFWRHWCQGCPLPAHCLFFLPSFFVFE